MILLALVVCRIHDGSRAALAVAAAEGLWGGGLLGGWARMPVSGRRVLELLQNFRRLLLMNTIADVETVPEVNVKVRWWGDDSSEPNEGR